MRPQTYFQLFIGALILAFMPAQVEAQIRPGIKFGLSTPDVDPKAIIVTDEQGVDLYQIFVVDARYGVHAGAFVQMQLGGFFIQPEILYNSTSIDYRIDEPANVDTLFRDTYRSIDFPVILGIKAGPVRLGGGPVGHINFEDEGGFSSYKNRGFNAFFEDLTWGWQAGIGLDVWKLHVDVRYEGNFSKLGDHITFFGKRYDFATNNNRLIGSLGFSF